MADNPDMQLAVEFFVKAVEHPSKSREEGRPIYDDREFVRIRFPADNKRELVAPAHERHYVSHIGQQVTYAERFPEVYGAFQRQEADFVTGTRLIVAPFLTESKRAELDALGVKTVEQLAGLPDGARKRLGMGAMELQRQAQEYLDNAKGTAEVDALRRRVAELEAQKEMPETEDAFSGFSDDDLKNMITDAGGEVPRGRAKRETLVSKLNELREAAEAAA